MLDIQEVWASIIACGEVIEDYPTDPRGASCLMFSLLVDSRPVHCVLGYTDLRETVVIITAYRPDLRPHEWNADYRIRQ